MAQSYQTDSGNLIIPNAYAQYKVQAAAAGLATSGVLMLVGEADAGPRFSLESDLQNNSFGPDQLSAVLAKYKSGPLVDAFKAASTPANDPDIVGAPASIILVKTNTSTQASTTLAKWDTTTYGTLLDKSYGKLGNLIYVQPTAQASEVLPTTGAFTYIPAVGTVAYDIRVNGGAVVGGTLSANTTPASFVSTVSALTGVAASGGVDRAILTVSGTLAVTANPGSAGVNVIDMTRSVAYANAPSVGDTLVIPTGSVIAGTGNANVGAYVVISVSSTVIRGTKLSDAGKAGAVAGTITAPVNVSATNIVALTDASCASPVTITLTAGNPVDGIGKTLVLSELTTGTDLLSRTTYLLGTTTPVTWVSKSASPQILVSATEYKVLLTNNRQVDGISETISAGGDIALKLGYTGTTATVTITPTTFATTVTGGSGASFTVNLADYPTLNDLAAYINAQTGYTASVGTAALGQLASSNLDDVAGAGICSTFGVQAGRLKVDAWRFFTNVNANSVLVKMTTAPTIGLPKPATGVAYLSGGAKGGSSNTDFTAAIDALQLVQGNFLVPLVSRDATFDITDGLTDSSSTYTIDSINAYAKTHVLAMSGLKRRKNRQAFVSKATDFTSVQTAASNIASSRVAMTFQDIKQVDSFGNLTQFLPWMGAVLAAGMQAAGFYRAIFNKGINCSGVVMHDGSYSDRDDTAVENALLAGLLPATRADGGGFTWVSDQTTYGKDNNFVYNSIQAQYMADTLALGTAKSMGNMFKGQSVADVSASIALSALETIFANYLRLKVIAPSDDAPKGFKNASIHISGGAMIVNAEVKIAGAIYFIPINFLVTPVSQTANS